MLFIIISDLFSEKGVDGAIGMPFFHVWCVRVCVCVCGPDGLTNSEAQFPFPNPYVSHILSPTTDEKSDDTSLVSDNSL